MIRDVPPKPSSPAFILGVPTRPGSWPSRIEWRVRIPDPVIEPRRVSVPDQPVRPQKRVQRTRPRKPTRAHRARPCTRKPNRGPSASLTTRRCDSCASRLVMWKLKQSLPINVVSRPKTQTCVLAKPSAFMSVCSHQENVDATRIFSRIDKNHVRTFGTRHADSRGGSPVSSASLSNESRYQRFCRASVSSDSRSHLRSRSRIPRSVIRAPA